MKRRSLFPGIVFGLLTTNMIVVGITLYLAHSDRSFAVEPAYDQRALSWDEQAAGQRRSDALGWTATFEIGAHASPDRQVAVRVRDRDGAPISGASAEVVAFHDARAGERYAAAMRAVEPGAYSASMPLKRPGQWEFRLVVRRGPETFSLSTHEELAP